MPLVRISLREGTSPEYRRAIADGVHRALLEALAVPVDDRFQVITEHDAEGLIYDPQYLGIQRSDRVVFVQITLSAGRETDYLARQTCLAGVTRIRLCGFVQRQRKPQTEIACRCASKGRN